MFVDYARIHVRAGNGGNGCLSFRREKNVPRGGPDGGHGGNGGDIILAVDPSKRTLLDFRFQHIYKADSGGNGLGNDRHGKSASHLLIGVPPGTVVREVETGQIVADLVAEGDSIVVANGGRGGRGNAAFSSSVNRAPRRHEDGEPGGERYLELELKVIADVGLIGHPNAGKSTLLARVSDATPKIGDYPFTTLEPNLGIVRIGDYDTFVVADIPGLIEGAHEGRGLGIQFLRHVERTRVLLFLIDASQPDPVKDFEVLREELKAFNPQLLSHPSLITLTKMDVITDWNHVEEIEAKLPGKILRISAVTGAGIPELLREIGKILFENHVSTSDRV